MKNLTLLLVTAFVAMLLLCCTKKISITDKVISQPSNHFVDVVLENKQKDAEVLQRKIKPCPTNNPHCQTQPPSPNPQPPTGVTTACILLDFDSHKTSGTLWNISGDIYSDSSGMSPAAISKIVDSVKFDYAFNSAIKVTTSEVEFNTYPVNKRMRVVITTSNEWSPGVGGIAYLNSFNWDEDAPAFVFSNALGFSVKNISEAISHEAGHTLSLRHQSVWEIINGLLTKTFEYDFGCCGTAPIMGAAYYEPNGIFKTGRNSAGQIQDDTAWVNNSVRL